MVVTTAESSSSAPLLDPSPRPLGRFSVNPVAFGSWRFTFDAVDEARGVLEAALDAGMNLVDSADVYGLDWGGAGFGRNEELLGRVLSDAPQLRDRMVLATKGGIMPPRPYDSGRVYLTSACEASLRRLGVETIDLYQIHRPDFYTHPEELAETLVSLREQGKIQEVGVSNYTASQTEALASFLPFPIVSDQPEFSLLSTEPLRNGVLDRCMQHRRVPLAWSPLAGGRLATGEGLPTELIETLDRIAEREQVDRAVLSIAFVLAHPAKPVAIVGSQNPERLAEQANATKVHLSRQDVYDLIQAAEQQPLP